MRQERTLINGTGESEGYTFFFQIANDGGRRACCVKIDALNLHEASALFRQKWSVIELMLVFPAVIHNVIEARPR